LGSSTAKTSSATIRGCGDFARCDALAQRDQATIAEFVEHLAMRARKMHEPFTALFLNAAARAKVGHGTWLVVAQPKR